jgi:hypothetical protein
MRVGSRIAVAARMNEKVLGAAHTVESKPRPAGVWSVCCVSALMPRGVGAAAKRNKSRQHMESWSAGEPAHRNCSWRRIYLWLVWLMDKTPLSPMPDAEIWPHGKISSIRRSSISRVFFFIYLLVHYRYATWNELALPPECSVTYHSSARGVSLDDDNEILSAYFSTHSSLTCSSCCGLKEWI